MWNKKITLALPSLAEPFRYALARTGEAGAVVTHVDTGQAVGSFSVFQKAGAQINFPSVRTNGSRVRPTRNKNFLTGVPYGRLIVESSQKDFKHVDYYNSTDNKEPYFANLQDSWTPGVFKTMGIVFLQVFEERYKIGDVFRG